MKNTYGSLLCFFNISSKFWPRGNTVWPIMSFQGSYISLFQGSNTNFHEASYISWCSQRFIKKLFVGQCGLTHIVLSRILYKFPPKTALKYWLKNCIWDIQFDPFCPSKGLMVIQISTKSSFFIFFDVQKLFKKFYQGHGFIMVWPILSFQGSYINVHLTLVYFLLLKIYWKVVSATTRFDRYFPFQGFYQVFIKGLCFFFLFQKSLRNLNHRQYGLTNIAHL